MPPPQLDVNAVLFGLELLGILAFAIAGALRAIEGRMDIFGVLVLAVITALGGGFIRDVLIDRFPISLATPVYFYTAIAGWAFTLIARRTLTKYVLWIKVFDAMGLGVFSALGAQVAITRHLNLLSILLLGLLTGIGGGILRDVLANDVPLVLRKEVYAMASLIGITVMWLLVVLDVNMTAATVVSAAVIFLVRMVAIHWNWNLPQVRS